MIKFGQKIINPDVKYHISSDFHFWHKNIMKFCSKTRPWNSVEEMNYALVKEWNSTVAPDDHIIHVGDFSFGNKTQTQAILDQLNGNITFLWGNHDQDLRNYTKGYDYLEFKYNKVSVVLSHYAFRVWNKSHYGSVHGYGHSHGSLEGLGRSMDVGYDANGKILLLEDFIEECLKKEIYKESHR